MADNRAKTPIPWIDQIGNDERSEQGTDIVTRLEAALIACKASSPCDCRCFELLDAIDEIEWLRTAGDALADVYWRVIWKGDEVSADDVRRAYYEWRVTRRG